MTLNINAPKYLKRYSRILGLPSLIIIIFLFLTVYIVRYAYVNITKDVKDLKTSQKDIEVIENRIKLLKQIANSDLIQADISYIALPDKNPGPWIVSHVRKISEKYGMILEDISFTKIREETEGSNMTSMELDIELKSTSIATNQSFLLDIKKIAPIVTVKEVKIDPGSDKATFKTTAKFNIYWSNLPAELPDLKQPLNNLSDAELKTLSEVSLLSRPIFINLDPNSPKKRDIPFN